MKLLLLFTLFMLFVFANSNPDAGVEVNNIVLFLDTKNIARTKTTKSAFLEPNDGCIPNPSTMSMRTLSFNSNDYIEYLKSINGTYFYVGNRTLEKFKTFPFTVDNKDQYFCGYLKEECGDLLMYLRCMLLIFN